MMRHLNWCAAIGLSFLANASWATQDLTVDPNGSVSFDISTTDVTRLSIVGDRIRRIINPDSMFLMTNDQETGDVYFRAETEATGSESGYILTESGVTINFTLRATTSVEETVLITVRSSEPEASIDSIATNGFNDNIALMMTDIVRDVAQAHVIGRAVPSGRNGRVVRTIQGNQWKATVRIAVAGANGRLVREQDFYRSGVRAVWIARNTLSASERTFVIVVEDE